MTPLLTKLLAGQLVPVDAAVSSDVIDNYLNKFSLNLCDISFYCLGHMDISPECKLLLLLYEADAEPPCGFQFL